jgi:5-methylcytosine-specific restriction endonuclease McrA
MTKNRYSNGHRRRQQQARFAARGDVCAICGDPINYDLPAGEPESFELDEIVPVALGGSCTDPDNLQSTHRICNRIKSDHLNVKLNGLAEAWAIRNHEIEPPWKRHAGITFTESARGW